MGSSKTQMFQAGPIYRLPPMETGNVGELSAQWSSTNIPSMFSDQLDVFFRFPVCNSGAYLMVADAAEYEPRSFEVLRTDKEVQIGEFPLRNLAVRHKRYRGTFENGDFDALRCKVADNLAQSSCKLEILRRLSKIAIANGNQNIVGNKDVLGSNSCRGPIRP